MLHHYLKLMRFDKPIGILLLLWPTLWALFIAANGWPPLKILIIFIVGVILMRAAGCVINDIADRNFDAFVERTQHRPLATKQISFKNALILFFILVFLAFLLVCNLNRFTILLSFGAAFLACLYPFTKRFTHWPQFFLGAAFAWSVPMSFAAIQNTIPGYAWILYAAALVWPLAYDTEYAMVDRADDLKIGVKSTAILFGRHDRLVVGALQALFLALMAFLGWRLNLAWPYGLGLGMAALLFAYQQVLIKKREPKACFKAFLNNNQLGFLIFLGLLIALGSITSL